MQYRMIGLPAAEAGVCPGSADESPPVIAAATRARLTYVDAGTSDLRCDVVLALDGPPAVISVPDSDRPVDLVVEYVDDAGAVVGRGVTRDIALDGVAQVDVRVAPAGGFACAPDRAAAGRAFHSATPLPNGEVLLLGGIAGPGGDEAVEPATGLFLQARAELYAPATGETRTVTIPGLVPRAFHQAYVVAGGDEITIAVLGGLTVTGDPATTPVAIVGTTYRLDASSAAIGAPGELLHYDVSASTFTREAVEPTGEVEARGFAALVPTGEGPIGYVGGFDPAMAARPPKTSADAVDPTSGLRTTTVATRRGRLGATVTAVDADTLIVWGGDPTAGVALETPEVAEAFTAWSTTPASSAVVLDAAGAQGPHRAFHGAALAGDGSVILGGGFRMDMGAALVPVASTYQRFVPATSTLTELADLGAGATPGGYKTALALADGDVLFAGGNPDPTAAGCATTDQGLVCANAEAWRYDTASSAIARTGDLGVPRYGLALTTLADGTILASGGLAPSGAALRAVADLELYEPRGAADDPLLPSITRVPGDVARTAGGDPLAPCAVVVEYIDAGN